MTHRLLAAALLLPLSLQPAVAAADTITLGAARDNTLCEDPAGGLSNGAGSSFFAGRTNDGGLRRGLIAFDVATQIPAGSTINTVTLTLNMSRTQAASEPIELHAVSADWGEGTSNAAGGEGGCAAATAGSATWLHRFSATINWTRPGGDFAATPSATLAVDATGQYIWGSTPEMVADVQGWLDQPASNFGWLLLGNESVNQTAKRFDSRESGSAFGRPALMVDYTPPVVPTGACCESGTCSNTTQANCPGVFLGVGTTCQPTNPCVTGACCNGTTCTVTTPAACAAPAVYQGDGTVCTPATCVATGACCNGTTCTITTRAACAAPAVYQGDGTVCTPATCVATGACCNGTTCTITTRAACAAPAVYQGDGTVCTPATCVATGACCNGTACTVTTQAACTGVFQGAGSTCQPTNPCTQTQATLYESAGKDPCLDIILPGNGIGSGTSMISFTAAAGALLYYQIDGDADCATAGPPLLHLVKTAPWVPPNSLATTAHF